MRNPKSKIQMSKRFSTPPRLAGLRSDSDLFILRACRGACFEPVEKQSPDSGQSLVEVVVAVGLILTAVVALLALATSGLRGSGFGVTKARATKLANEELELVRAYRDSVGWSVFDDSGGGGVASCSDFAPCYMNSNPLGVASGTDTSAPPFTRYFVTEPNAVGQSSYKIIVHVIWTDQSGSHDVTISSILTDWQ